MRLQLPTKIYLVVELSEGLGLVTTKCAVLQHNTMPGNETGMQAARLQSACSFFPHELSVILLEVDCCSYKQICTAVDEQRSTGCNLHPDECTAKSRDVQR